MERAELTVLAIDDHPDNLTALEALMAEVLPRARLLTAASGEWGLELALASDPDVILLDIVMPGLDGFEVCRRLKNDPRLEHVPVVFLTALHADRRNRLRALAVGAEGFLAQPVDALELEAQVRAMAKIKAGNVRRLRESERLAEMVDERTRELKRELDERRRAEAREQALEARLRQQQKLEALGTLAGGVAHEINNPVAIILNCAELLQDEARADPATASNLANIVEAAGRVGKIVRSLLSFARQDEEAMTDVRLDQVVLSTLSLVRKLFEREHITCQVEVVEGLPSLRGRSGQLAQVLMNLLTNARDAVNERHGAGPGAKRVAVRLGPAEHEGRPCVRLTVDDNGVGVSDAAQARLFDPFFTTKPRDVGTGLGLSISHGIVAEHGGRLSYEPCEGGGARFVVELPVGD